MNILTNICQQPNIEHCVTMIMTGTGPGNRMIAPVPVKCNSMKKEPVTKHNLTHQGTNCVYNGCEVLYFPTHHLTPTSWLGMVCCYRNVPILSRRAYASHSIMGMVAADYARCASTFLNMFYLIL